MHLNCSVASSIATPELPYPNEGEAANWLCQAFGFVGRLLVGDFRAGLQIGEGSLVSTKGGNPNPSFSVMVRVENIAPHDRSADKSGTLSRSVPEDDPYGERQYVAGDSAGLLRPLSKPNADVAPSTRSSTLAA